MPTKSVRLLALSLLLAVLSAAMLVWAVSAYRYAARTHHWRSSVGVVIAPNPASDVAALRFRDAAGQVHLLALHAGDTDDMPLGSVIRVSYHHDAAGRFDSEITVLPGARASALATIGLAFAAAAGVGFWRYRAETRRQPEGEGA